MYWQNFGRRMEILAWENMAAKLGQRPNQCDLYFHTRPGGHGYFLLDNLTDSPLCTPSAVPEPSALSMLFVAL